MKSIFRLKLGLVSSIFLMPLMATATVNAQAQMPQLACEQQQSDKIVLEDVPIVCDLAIKKEVKVNDGEFTDANNDPNAAIAHVGDKLTWRITVSNNSTSGLVPGGIVYVTDVLPTLLELVSVTASNGNSNYSPIDGWAIDLSTDLTATLTFVTKATTITTLTNTATLSTYDSCNDRCISSYADDDPTNNFDSAVAMIFTPPQVLGASTTATLADTGAALYSTLAAGILILSSVGTYAYAYRKTKR